jgi:hypothetical protein
MKNTINLFAFSFFLASLAGCSTTSPMKVALTELGTSSRSEYGAYGLRMTRSINITGMAPEETIGSISVDPDRFNIIEQLKRFKLNPQDLPDIMAPRLNDGASMVYERTFCGNDQGACPTNDEIAGVKDAIERQEVNIAKLANLQVEQQIISLVESAIARKPEDADKLLTAIKLQIPTNEDIKASTKDDYSAKFADAKSKIQSNIDVVKKVLEDNKIAINKPGIVVTNWKYQSDLSADGGIPGLGGAFNKNKDIAGYAIFGNPVVRSLHFGTNDITGNQNNLFSNNANIQKLFNEKRLYMTFYQVRAQQVLYAESLESTLSAQLSVKLKELTTTLKPLLGAVDLQTLSQLDFTASATYARYSLSANQGFLDAGSGKLKRYEFKLGKLINTCNCDKDKYEDIENITVPIINSRINLAKYLEAYKN